MMDEETVDPEYKAGFNDGYALQHADDKLAEEYMKRHKANPRLKDLPKNKGMADGIFQARVEKMQKEFDHLFSDEHKADREHGH